MRALLLAPLVFAAVGVAIGAAVPPPRSLSYYFGEADIVATGTIEGVRVGEFSRNQYKVAFRFHAQKYWKGKDKKEFGMRFDVFDPSLDAAQLKAFYGRGAFVFFYRIKRLRTLGVIPRKVRDTIWLTPVGKDTSAELSVLSGGTLEEGER